MHIQAGTIESSRFSVQVSEISSTSGLCPFLHAARAADLSLREQVRPGAAAAAQRSAPQGRCRLVPLDAGMTGTTSGHLGIMCYQLLPAATTHKNAGNDVKWKQKLGPGTSHQGVS